MCSVNESNLLLLLLLLLLLSSFVFVGLICLVLYLRKIVVLKIGILYCLIK